MRTSKGERGDRPIIGKGKGEAYGLNSLESTRQLSGQRSKRSIQPIVSTQTDVAAT